MAFTAYCKRKKDGIISGPSYKHKYLKSMFDFLGIKDYKIVRTLGTEIRNSEVVLQ